jgi:isocitrate dehydrogenase
VAPQELDVVIFRENTEDLYSGIEFEARSDQAKHVIAALAELGIHLDEDSDEVHRGRVPRLGL